MKLISYSVMFILSLSPLLINDAQAASSNLISTASVQNVETNDSPAYPVAKLYEALNFVQQSTSGNFNQRAAILSTVLEKSYDFPVILEKTVGYRYSSFTAPQKAALMNAFKRYTIARYLSNFNINDNITFKILPANKSNSNNQDIIINTFIISDGDSTPIDYLVNKTPEGWKIVDVLLNGHISQIAVQHGDFTSTLVKGGSQALVDMLNQKIQSFSSEK